MRIIAKRVLREFWEIHNDAEMPLRTWFHDAERSRWMNTQHIKAVYRNASFVGDNRVVFNICGNKYRLIVKFEFKYGVGYVRFIGTHKQYDRIDARTV